MTTDERIDHLRKLDYLRTPINQMSYLPFNYIKFDCGHADKASEGWQIAVVGKKIFMCKECADYVVNKYIQDGLTLDTESSNPN